jgi:hypothetical protein
VEIPESKVLIANGNAGFSAEKLRAKTNASRANREYLLAE